MFHERSGFHVMTLRGVEVSVSIWYLFLMVIIIASPGFSGGAAAEGIAHGILFAFAVTLALLVHEFGHALVSQYYDLEPSVLLHGFGGLCMHRPARTDGDDARILLAGPGAGLVFGAVAMGLQISVAPAVGSTVLDLLLGYLVWVNFVWSLINLLLPIWPLDGGKLFHLLLRRLTSSGTRAREMALKTSIVTTMIAAGGSLYLLGPSLYILLLCFFILMGNIRMLRQGTSLVERSVERRGPTDFQAEMLEEAQEARAQENWREVYRLCHQLRSTGGDLGPDVLETVWTLLSISATRLGKYDEAESYFERAPDTDDVQRARQEWESARGGTDDEHTP